MRTLKNILALAGFAVVSASAVAAPQAKSDFVADMSLSASSGYLFRGVELSPDEVSFGGNLGLRHISGFGLNLKTQTGNLGVDFMHTQAGVTYSFFPVKGVHAKMGIEKNVVTGFAGSSSANFTDAVGSVSVGGFTGSVAYGMQGDILRKKSLYTELGYTHKFGSNKQYHVGADVGYTIYGGEIADAGAVDGVSLAQLRAGVKLNQNFDLGVTYQLNAAKDIAGQKAESNDKVGLNLRYKF